MSNVQPDEDVFITVQIKNEQFEINVKREWKLTSIIKGFIRNDYFKNKNKEILQADIEAYVNGQLLNKQKKIRDIFEESKQERIEDLVITLVDRNQKKPKKPESLSDIVILQEIKLHEESYEKKKQQKKAEEKVKEAIPEEAIHHKIQMGIAYTSDVRGKQKELMDINFSKSQQFKIPQSRLKADPKAQKSTKFTYSSKVIEDSEFGSKETYWIDVFHKIMKTLQDFTTGMKWEISEFKEGEETNKYLEEILLRVKKDRQNLDRKLEQNYSNIAELQKKLKQLQAENINLKSKQQNDAKIQKMSDSLSILKKQKLLYMNTISKENSSEKQQKFLRELRNVVDLQIKSLEGYFSLHNQNLNMRTLTNLFSNYQNKPNLISIMEFQDSYKKNHHLAVYTPAGISQKSIKNLIHKDKNANKFFIYDLERQVKFKSEQVERINIGFHNIELFGHILGIEVSQTSKIAVKINHGKVNSYNDDFWKQIPLQEGNLKSLQLYQVQFVPEKRSSKNIP